MVREAIRAHLASSRTLKSCPGCATIDGLISIADKQDERQEELETTVNALAARVSHAEMETSRLEGIVSGIPSLIDAKFDALIHVLKTRDSIADAVARGKDPQNSTPAGSGLTLPGGVRWKAPPLLIAVVLMIVSIVGALVAGWAYVEVKRSPAVTSATTTG